MKPRDCIHCTVSAAPPPGRASEGARAAVRLDERPRRWRESGGSGRRWCLITNWDSTAMAAGNPPPGRKEVPFSNAQARQPLSRIKNLCWTPTRRCAP